MLKKTKIIASLFCMILLVGSIGNLVSASELDRNILANNPSYTINISNSEDIAETLIMANGALVNMETGETFDLEIEESNIQKLSNDYNRVFSNERVESYKAEVVVNATFHTQSGSGSDNSLAMKGFVTLYYYTYDSNGFSYVSIDKVDYRFENYDSSVTISNKQIVIAQNGVGYTNGGKAVTTQKTTRNALDSETILVRNWNWIPILKYGAPYVCGVELSAVLQRGQQSNWNFIFNFNLT